jgi:hypothetical protein
MGERLMLRRAFEDHRHRLAKTKSGRFSLDRPHSFPLRNPRHFVGTCYEHPPKRMDTDDTDLYLEWQQPAPAVRKPWNSSVIMERRRPRRPRSAAGPTMTSAPRSGGGLPLARPHTAGAGGQRHAVASSYSMRGSFDSPSPSVTPYEWGVSGHQQSRTDVDTSSSSNTAAAAWAAPPNTGAVATSAAAAAAAAAAAGGGDSSDWSVDLQPAQAQTFCDFVRLLNEVGEAPAMAQRQARAPLAAPAAMHLEHPPPSWVRAASRGFLTCAPSS